MKKITLIFFILSSFISFSQDVFMQNGTVTQCSGTFYDSGGSGSNYGSNETLVLTICPEEAGQSAQLNFTLFNTQLNGDILTIYDGDSTAATSFGSFSGGSANNPGFITASGTNPTGCLTIEFISNTSGTGSGWAATISCFTPCQEITAQLDSTTPSPSASGEILICVGGDVTFEGSAVFSVDGAGATYEWDFGNATSGTGQIATATYDTPGIYVADLVVTDINPLGCTSINSISQVIRVSPEIDFTDTVASKSTICFGETTTITGVAQIPQFEDCAPQIFDETWLQDTQSTGQPASYSSTITVDCYGPGQVITDISQITDICVNIEHSFIGDLDIYLVAPNGTRVDFLEYGDGNDPGAYFGVPDQADNGVPGVGAQYCFSPTAAQSINNVATGGSSVPAGTYAALPTSSFNNIVGSPLNGNWTFVVTDLWAADDGTLFSWNLNFDPSIVPPSNTITSETWDPDTSIINTTGNIITVQPVTAGIHCYTYRAMDDFGCEYSKEVCIEMIPEVIYSEPNNLFLCNPGSAPYIFDLTENTPIILATAPIPADLIVTYHESQADANSDVSEIPDPENYSGTDGQIIYVRIEYQDSGCHSTDSFTLNITSQPSISPVADLIVCDDASNDGFAEFDLESQSATILGAQPSSDFTVTYYTSFTNADTSTGALTSPYTNTSDPQPIFVRVERIGDASCNNVSATALFNLDVEPSDDASFTMTPTCDGATATVNGTPGGTFTFNPAPTDGAVINPSNGTVTGATSNASYTVEYTTSGNCPLSSTQTFSVSTIDDATFTLSPTCDGATATVSGDAGGTFAFNPLPGDLAIIDAATGTITQGTSGASYTVEYMTSGACPSSSIQSVTVLTTDDPTFTLTATCDGATASVIGTTGGTFAFNPLPNDAASINASTGTITGGNSAASYTVEYTTNGQCPSSSIQIVTVLTSDDASFTLTPACDGGAAIVTGTLGGTFSFIPLPSDSAVIDDLTGTVTGATPGASYTIRYTTSGICPVSNDQVLNVLPVDNSSFTMSPTCDGGTATVTGAIGGTFAFNPLPIDSAVIDSDSGTVINATPGETYTVEYTSNGICPSTSTETFTVHPLPLAVPPTTLQVCDDNIADGFTSIDLSLKSSEIRGGNPDYVVTYHLTQADADSGASPLPIPYTNISNPQIVHARVESATTGCHSTVELELQVAQAPVANEPSALEYCDADSDGFGEFTLTDSEPQITGGATGLTVTYHETEEDAQNNVNPQTSPYSNIAAYEQTIYVRIESATIATDCASFVDLLLIVKDTPQIEDPAPLEVCDDGTADGFALFNLTDRNAEILDGLDPTQYAVSYYGQQADASVPTNAVATPNAYTNTVAFGQTLWVRVDDTVNGCHKLTTLDLVVNSLPVLVQPTPLSLCDVNSPGDQMEAFTLEDANAEILNGQSGITLTYHLNQADAVAGTAPLSSPYVNTSNAQTLYVRATNSDTGCADFTTLTIRVLPIPTPGPDPSDIILCDDTNTGDTVEAFDLTANETYIINGEGGVTPTYHTTFEDANDGTDAIADPTAYTNTATLQTIYVRVTNDLTGCYTVVDFDISVNPLPAVLAVTDYILCEVNTDGFAQFDLTSKDAALLDGQDPALYSVSYHATQEGADNLTGALVSPYTNTTNPQRIYVAITNTDTGCSISTPSFNIEVDNGAEATDPLTPYAICDNVGDNDGLGQFDLTTQDAEILGLQDPANFIVTYYATQVDARQGVNPIPYTYENITNPQVIYVRVDNDTPDTAGMDSSICYEVAQLTLQVDLNPIFDLDDSYTLCVDTNGTEVLGPPVLDTGLSSTDYSFEWSLDGTLLPVETGSSLTAGADGTYSVVVTNNVTGCTSNDSAEVVISSPPTVEVEVNTQAFAENHVITVTATGDGEYEYSLDNGAWQTDGTFENVSSGDHTVTARDINGCGENTKPFTILDYPHFFTPNGDGRNETWNIVGFTDQPSTKIYIFDRFGKLLKQISPLGAGWNGTYNGREMPSSDYWFTVEYGEDGQQKQFRAHFTLKR